VTAPFFPHYIRTVDEALDFLVDWAEQIAGTITSDITVIEHAGPGVIEVMPFRVVFPASGTRLTGAVIFSAEETNEVHKYNFDLRVTGRSGQLIQRWDNHPGHEHEHGGPTHRHQLDDRGREVRVAEPARTLAQIAGEIAQLDIDRTLPR